MFPFCGKRFILKTFLIPPNLGFMYVYALDVNSILLLGFSTNILFLFSEPRISEFYPVQS